MQRFNPAVPARAGTRADYVLAAQIAKLCAINLEARSPLLVMNRIAAAEKAFAAITFAHLAEVSEQWPIVGRGDLYYGGTSYENTQGLGVHLAPASVLVPQPVAPRGRIEYKNGQLLAVPVTKLYDMGGTVTPSILITNHIGTPAIVLNPATAAKLGLENGAPARISLNDVDANVNVKFEESVAPGVVLIYRSFGIPISEPAAVSISVAEKA